MNIEKTNYTLFHKSSIKDDIHLKMPGLKIGDNVIKRQPSIKFLGVILDENASCKDLTKTVENTLRCLINRGVKINEGFGDLC